MTCRLFGLKPIEIVRTTDPCAVCMAETGDFVRFPASCGHVFCASCVRDLVFHREKTVDFVSPVRFGGPTCPRGCDNPMVGRQCDCDEYAEALFHWVHCDFTGFSEWAVAKERQRIREESTSARGSRVCPVCRSKVPIPENAIDVLKTEIMSQIRIL